MIDAELDLCPAYGWQGGPEFFTRIVTLRNGSERRNANWAGMRHHFTLPFQNITDADYLLYLKSVFVAAQGQAESFLVKDHSDHTATLEALGTTPSGSTPVQLKKSYTFGATTVSRDITKPVSTGLVVYQNGSPKAGTVDAATGLFTPTTAWTGSATLTWSGEFRVPVRFASDILSVSIDSRRGNGEYAINGSVELIEVFNE